jgi:hypothetical protein
LVFEYYRIRGIQEENEQRTHEDTLRNWTHMELSLRFSSWPRSKEAGTKSGNNAGNNLGKKKQQGRIVSVFLYCIIYFILIFSMVEAEISLKDASYVSSGMD